MSDQPEQKADVALPKHENIFYELGRLLTQLVIDNLVHGTHFNAVKVEPDHWIKLVMYFHRFVTVGGIVHTEEPIRRFVFEFRPKNSPMAKLVIQFAGHYDQAEALAEDLPLQDLFNEHQATATDLMVRAVTFQEYEAAMQSAVVVVEHALTQQ